MTPPPSTPPSTALSTLQRPRRRTPAVSVEALEVVDGRPLDTTAVPVALTELRITLRHRHRHRHGPVPTADQVVLVGPRQEVVASAVRSQGDRLVVTVPLLTRQPWGHVDTPPLPGRYRLTIGPDAVPTDGPVRLTVPDRGAGPTPSVGVLVAQHGAAGLVLLLAPYRKAGVRFDDVAAGQGEWRATYRRSSSAVDEGLVLLSSFEGRTATDNPAAIARELRRRAPELRQVWVVGHHGVVPADADGAVLAWTRSWWQAMARARYVITNAWLPAGFVDRPGQVVVQAWHGTPFKLLGVDRQLGAERRQRIITTRRHSAIWDVMIAQNPYSAEIFARTYAFDGPLPVTGYPRNDELALASPVRTALLRDHLGLREGETVVLYAPTFRDGQKGMYDGLDYALLLRLLAPSCPAGVRLLVRGHANTISRDREVQVPGVVDVTLYPDIAELFAVADVLVTDYSSAMFDFAVTGRPMVFHVPDLQHYRDELRGTYFDLAATAPGPLTTTTEETAAAVARAASFAAAASSASSAPAVPPEWVERYRRWRQTYVPADDGDASRRAVDVVLSLP